MNETITLEEIKERIAANLRPMLVIVRGCPGSGKSTLAAQLVPGYAEADQYFARSGIYTFVHSDLPIAHKWCQEKAVSSMANGETCVVSNTFVKKWELAPYITAAIKYGYDTLIVRMESTYGTAHNIPEAALERMRLTFAQVAGELVYVG